MNGHLKLRVLLSIYYKDSFIIPRALLTPHYGYGKLRSEGLISVRKQNNLYYVTVTEIGEAFIAVSLMEYE